jgi:hypothetical protein
LDSDPYSVDQKDLAERWTGGIITGEVVKVLIWLTAKRPHVASWSKATDWMAAFGPKGFSRSEIYPLRMRFTHYDLPSLGARRPHWLVQA